MNTRTCAAFLFCHDDGDQLTDILKITAWVTPDEAGVFHARHTPQFLVLMQLVDFVRLQ